MNESNGFKIIGDGDGDGHIWQAVDERGRVYFTSSNRNEIVEWLEEVARQDLVEDTDTNLVEVEG